MTVVRPARRPPGDRGPFPEPIGPFVAADVTRITGTKRDDVLAGTDGDDVIRPKLGRDKVDGNAGFDTLIVDYGSEPTAKRSGSFITMSDEALSGDARSIGNLCYFTEIERLALVCSSANDQINIVATGTGDFEILSIDAGGGDDILYLIMQELNVGKAVEISVDDTGAVTTSLGGRFLGFSSVTVLCDGGDDILAGGSGNDMLDAGSGNDILDGRGGDDHLRGDEGTDVLTGGTGADLFDCDRFGGFGDRADRITDFSHAEGDIIDLSGWDADKVVRGDQAFVFVGAGAFTGTRGEVRYTDNQDGSYTVEYDRDHDMLADAQLIATADQPLVAADFYL